MLTYVEDAFNGVIISTALTDLDAPTFSLTLKDIIDEITGLKKQLAWLTLTHEQAQYIPIATALGFVFHNCLEHEITLILRLKADAYAPFVPTHSIGAGALVINEQQVLVVKDAAQESSGFKLPGGHVELNEDISEAAVRETFEETGIKTEFESIIGLGCRHQYRFGKSNIYFICKLKPTSHDIVISDPKEILAAEWVDIAVFLADENNSPFNKMIISSLSDTKGLLHSQFNLANSNKREVFLGQQ
ncbi:NUDIX hydrolase [Algibacillus agarilyticus]|uniref:NUDIX hydrolase n=1 Tax=Algibacillus agarilyticus TaxID=2234133 RepID=UPI000DCFD7E6|nr:NUDIX domain-containing protein [Algibacillus agarilyticus]